MAESKSDESELLPTTLRFRERDCYALVADPAWLGVEEVLLARYVEHSAMALGFLEANDSVSAARHIQIAACYRDLVNDVHERAGCSRRVTLVASLEDTK